MVVDPVAVVGIAATCTASIPQIIQSMRPRTTTQLSAITIAVRVAGGIAWGVYAARVRDDMLLVSSLVVIGAESTLAICKARDVWIGRCRTNVEPDLADDPE